MALGPDPGALPVVSAAGYACPDSTSKLCIGADSITNGSLFRGGLVVLTTRVTDTTDNTGFESTLKAVKYTFGRFSSADIAMRFRAMSSLSVQEVDFFRLGQSIFR